MSRFVKSQALGNDYIFVREEELIFELTPENIRWICDRHFGVGSDGLLVKVPTTRADFGLRIFNPDGSEAQKSGNGLRIFANCLYRHEKNCPEAFSIETPSGVVHSKINLVENKVKDISVEMGVGHIIFDGVHQFKDQSFSIVSLSLGNPHCVVFNFDFSKEDFKIWGPVFENDVRFPNRTNVQFVNVLSPTVIQAYIWERGAGHTLASGSSACAVALACRSRGLVENQVTVQMEGGSLSIDIGPDGAVLMTGTAEEVYVGTLTKRVNL